MQRKNWFTLMEMLIVIVIIWILGAAILPRLTWYLAKTRDLKRQMDLRTIATAVESYKNQHGEFPVMGKNSKHTRINGSAFRPYLGSTKYLKDTLKNYIKEIPTDPQKNNNLELINHRCSKWKCDKSISDYTEKGDYFYILPKIGENERRAILIAKVETPDAANYVDQWFLGRSLTTTNDKAARRILKNERTRFFCKEIVKGTSMVAATKDNSKCTYTNEEQLWYIINID